MKDSMALKRSYSAVFGILAAVLMIWISWSAAKWTIVAPLPFLGWSQRTTIRLWFGIGIISAFMAGLSMACWGFKKLIIESKKNKVGIGQRINGRILPFLRENHIYFGWLAFAVALGHSIFFLIDLPKRMNYYLYSGVAAMLAMFILLVIGIMYQYKTLKIKNARYLHIASALIFGLLLIIHVI